MREVKRKAEVGEKIKIVDAQLVPVTDGKDEYKNGDILRVLYSDPAGAIRYADGVADNHLGRLVSMCEYVVLEEDGSMRFKVGDRVKVVANKFGHGFKIGEYVQVVGVRETDYRLKSPGGGWWFARDEELEAALFTLSDLKPCMVVKLRDGELGIVSTIAENEMCVNLENGMFMELLTHEEDLSFKADSDCDIMEVYGFSEYAYEANKISTEYRELLFKREEPKPKRKMTVAEICKELGEEIEIVKGE